MGQQCNQGKRMPTRLPRGWHLTEESIESDLLDAQSLQWLCVCVYGKVGGGKLVAVNNPPSPCAHTWLLVKSHRTVQMNLEFDAYMNFCFLTSIFNCLTSCWDILYAKSSWLAHGIAMRFSKDGHCNNNQHSVHMSLTASMVFWQQKSSGKTAAAPSPMSAAHTSCWDHTCHSFCKWGPPCCHIVNFLPPW